MTPTQIIKITITYKADFSFISPQDFKKGFTASFTEKIKKTLKKNNLAFNLAFNSKEKLTKDENKNQKLNRYSKIQYQTNKNEFIIVGIEDGAKLLEIWLDFLSQKNNLIFKGKTIEILSIDKTTHYWYPKLQNKAQIYKITAWKPFSSDTLADEKKFDKIIWGNIHRMLGDVNINFQEKVKIDILEFQRKNMVKGYKINWITYDLIFTTNINLPQHIGIGHEVSLGSGKITKAKLM